MNFHFIALRAGSIFFDFMLLGFNFPGQWPYALFSVQIFKQYLSKELAGLWEVRVNVLFFQIVWSQKRNDLP